MSCSLAVCSRSLQVDRHHQQRKRCHSERGLLEEIQYCTETALPEEVIIIIAQHSTVTVTLRGLQYSHRSVTEQAGLNSI